MGDFWKVGDSNDGNGSHPLRLAHGHMWPTWATPPEKSARRLTDVELDDPSSEYEHGGLGCQCDTCASMSSRNIAIRTLRQLANRIPDDERVCFKLGTAIRAIQELPEVDVLRGDIWIIVRRNSQGRNLLMELASGHEWRQSFGPQDEWVLHAGNVEISYCACEACAIPF